jgi:phage virion morphogenesis protein
MRIDIQVDDQGANAAFTRLEQAGLNPRPALLLIGEYMVDATKRRFQESRAPDGSAWAPNSPVTYTNLLGRFRGSSGKDGRLTKSGGNRAMGKKPLIGETRSLSTTINYRADTAAVEIGSPMEYAAVQQFGAKKGQFGRTKRGAPIPWGDIPARPFLGVNSDDWAAIREIFNDYLTGA